MRIQHGMAWAAGIVVLCGACVAVKNVYAHCDSLNGPVVQDARLALDKGDPAPVLKWVPAEREDEIREALRRARAVRTSSPEARELADQFFFETVVRVHRAGEGEPFTGLKPANTVEAGIAAADHALEAGTVKELEKHLLAAAGEGLRRRFDAALALKKTAASSVQKGREFVQAYVDYFHYVERLHALASAGHHVPAAAEADHHGH